MDISSAAKLGAVQRLRRRQLLDVCQNPGELGVLQAVLDKSEGETLAEIRSDLVELTDTRMQRTNRFAAASLGLGLCAAVVAGISGRPWLATAMAGGGLLGAGAGLVNNLNAYQENTHDLQVLLMASGRALR